MAIALFVVATMVAAQAPALRISSPQDNTTILSGQVQVLWSFADAPPGSQATFFIDGTQYNVKSGPFVVPLGEGEHEIIGFLKDERGVAYPNREAQAISRFNVTDAGGYSRSVQESGAEPSMPVLEVVETPQAGKPYSQGRVWFIAVLILMMGAVIGFIAFFAVKRPLPSSWLLSEKFRPAVQATPTAKPAVQALAKPKPAIQATPPAKPAVQASSADRGLVEYIKANRHLASDQDIRDRLLKAGHSAESVERAFQEAGGP